MRDQDLVWERLLRHYAVRVRHRGELIGILLDTDLWTNVVEQIKCLQMANEQFEDEAALALIEKGANDQFVERLRFCDTKLNQS